ncbi:hypothetical protein NIA69_18945 [Gemmiger formicilis]|nr:hypothetical protein [Gemmiger formicilis]
MMPPTWRVFDRAELVQHPHFAGGQGSWVEPNGRHYAPLPRLPWQEDDVAEVPQ